MNFNSDADVRACDNIREELQEYIQSQYSNAVTICTLLETFREEILPDADIRSFVEEIMSLETATGKNLDVLGRVIGIGRTITGFYDDTYTLSDERYRDLLRYKALANITDTSLATLNKMMAKLFPSENIKVFNMLDLTTNGDMTYNGYPMHVRWITSATVDNETLALFVAGGTLCLSAGVGWELMPIDEDNVFGFNGSGLQPFNQGVFYDRDKIIRS